ncbi:glycine betaine/proline transport system substrate-binding protein [Chromohalobacter canadensis]|uniref:Glycine betaine/proline transport system substrate-binding protein n=1 Tax=Chromohalobacter canadensis TaxID=141389 RepID=A0A285VY02_9GAMM|nr:ABC transporter substrate-binding protein [Chromohalobacter canadensis]SOC58146.1 glycine betaine/proline transport system substrate-binding protein [Chromohalobacter canadensis]
MTATPRHRTPLGRLKSTLIGGAMGALLLAPFGIAQAEDDRVRFGTPQWPGATVKSEVARQILDTLGYRTSLREASSSIILEGMASGDLDVNMALWRPSQSGMLDPRLESGELVEVVKNIDGARFQLAVPEYVWDAGVHSMADLAEHAERFDRTFYGIEPGNVGNELMQKAIDDGTYGLDDWRVAASSETGMMSQVESDIRNDQWIAFLGWEPHWMNVDFDIRYLEDPENLWGDASSVSTVVASDFAERYPNVIAFLDNMVVPIEVQDQWVYAFSRNDQPLEAVAANWIQSHPERVNAWLEGVTTADGETRAQDAYQASR